MKQGENRIGIDLGSRNVKLALLRGNEARLLQYETIEFYRQYAEITAGGLRLRAESLDLGENPRIMACGYGKQAVAVTGGRSIPEIQAHAAGACHQTGQESLLLIDVGGQDTKIILVKNGAVGDFATNDKCAASGGRYLENMAAVLGMKLSELARYREDPVPLSSTCAVFGESELVGKIIEGVPLPQLAAGVNLSVAKRVLPLASRFLLQERGLPVYFGGGVALNQSVVALLSTLMGKEIAVLPEPLHNGAIGCAIRAV